MGKITELKHKLVSTAVVGWRNTLTSAALAIMSVAGVAAFGYVFFTIPQLQCHAIFVYLSIAWLISELAVITYLCIWRNIPRFAREAVACTLIISNIWFILFLFGLTECTT